MDRFITGEVFDTIIMDGVYPVKDIEIAHCGRR
jgi:hypothetical protein